MRSHLTARLVAVATMLAGAAGGAAAAAPPAAAIQQCQGYQYQIDYGVRSSPSPYVYVDDTAYCIPGPGGNLFFPVTISKYIGNVGWQVVATGKGSATYTCTGGKFLYTTSVTTNQNKPSFYCG
jgi:hypothetical protein